MRKGEAGNWTKHLTPDMVKRFEEWEAEALQGTGLKFEYGV
jgi:hypothetical protein